MTDTKCPCIECICVPVCKNKDYAQLLRDCSTVRHLLYVNGIAKPGNRTYNFHRILKDVSFNVTPVLWTPTEE